MAIGKVKSVKPVGRDVGPEAEIEMSSGDYRFVYREAMAAPKRYTTLEVLTSPRHEQLYGARRPTTEWNMILN